MRSVLGGRVASSVTAVAVLAALAGCGTQEPATPAQPEASPPTGSSSPPLVAGTIGQTTATVAGNNRHRGPTGFEDEPWPATIDTTKRIPARAKDTVEVSALLEKDGQFDVLTKTLPKRSSRHRIESAMQELGETDGVVAVDWSYPPRPASSQPNDPRWFPDKGQPSQQVPMSRIGLCCSGNGLVDGWDLLRDRLAYPPLDADGLPVGPPADVNIAILDSGLMYDSANTSRESIEADLKSRFIGGWDKTAKGVSWDDYQKAGEIVNNGKKEPLPDKDLRHKMTADASHGTEVAGQAVATANNGHGIAGAAGILPNIKFGMFRVFDWKQEKPIKDGGLGHSANRMDIPEALTAVLNDVRQYQSKKGGGRDWPLINMSFGSTASFLTRAELLSSLAGSGVLAVAASGNERLTFGNDDETSAAYGVNPVMWPAAHQDTLSVAAWGQWKGGVYEDNTADYSSSNPFVDVTAPGTSLPTLGYSNEANNSSSGTSLAAPLLTGIAANLIAVSGDRYRCTRPGLKNDQRAKCVGDLRAALLRAADTVRIPPTVVNPLGAPAETPDKQGAGVINTVSLYGQQPPAQLPPPAKVEFTAKTITTDQKYGYQLVTFGDPVVTITPDPNADRNTLYRVFFNGDGTRKVTENELNKFKMKIDKNAKAKQDSDGWEYPSFWSERRIPLPTIASNKPPDQAKPVSATPSSLTVSNAVKNGAHVEIAVEAVVLTNAGHTQLSSVVTRLDCVLFHSINNVLSLPAPGVTETIEAGTLSC